MFALSAASRRRAFSRAARLAAAAIALATAPLSGQTWATGGTPLEELSLEELLRVEVTSLSGLAVEQFSAPAAVYVVHADEIRRSGAATLPEALRLPA